LIYDCSHALHPCMLINSIKCFNSSQHFVVRNISLLVQKSQQDEVIGDRINWLMWSLSVGLTFFFVWWKWGFVWSHSHEIVDYLLLLFVEESGVFARCCRADSSPVDSVWSGRHSVNCTRSTYCIFTAGDMMILMLSQQLCPQVCFHLATMVYVSPCSVNVSLQYSFGNPTAGCISDCVIWKNPFSFHFKNWTIHYFEKLSYQFSAKGYCKLWFWVQVNMSTIKWK